MTEILLGPECDDELFYRLVAEVEAMGGSVVDKEWTLGGSQEVTLFRVTLPGAELEAVAETYVGLTLRGDAFLVKAIADQVVAGRHQ
jgi:hypothetical protein